MIEVEFKCRLTSAAVVRVQEKLTQFVYWGEKQNHDIYYDTPEWDLLRQAVFLRVRNGTRLEWKFNPEIDLAHTTSIERVFALKAEPFLASEMNVLCKHFLPDWQEVEHFSEAVARGTLVELAQIENMRRLYRTADHLKVSLDQVTALGTFLEIEGTCAEGEDEEPLRRAAALLVEELSLQHLPVGYVELWLQEHKPEAYLVGQYKL